MKDEIIDYCIEQNFKKNCINHLSKKADWKPYPNETYLEFYKNEIRIIEENPIQDKRRLSFVIKLLQVTIESRNLDLNCRAIFNVTDGVDPNEYYSRICFSAPIDSNHLLMPDLHLFYHIKAIGENLKNDSAFEDKNNLISFFGSDSGLVGEDLMNQRIKFCNKANKNQFVTAKISNFVHFTEEMLNNLGINKSDISSKYISINDQLSSKFILDIDGNGASWDRILWAMHSNCYFIHLKSDTNKNTNWYRPFAEKNNIIPTYTEEEILAGAVEYNQDIKIKQKEFAKTILRQDTQIDYFAKLLTKYNEIYNQ